jgi:hypothetical protein
MHATAQLQAGHQLLTNKTVQRQSLSENQNQDHTHKQLGLLGIGPARRKARSTHSQGQHAQSKPCAKPTLESKCLSA